MNRDNPRPRDDLGRMSASGQTAKCRPARVMSDLHPTADVAGPASDFRKVPWGDLDEPLHEGFERSQSVASLLTGSPDRRERL